MSWKKKVTVLACCTGVGLWLALRDWNPSLHELARIQNALLQTHSWHKHTASGPIETDEDVSCPDFHTVTRNTGAPGNPVVSETVRVGAFAYQRGENSPEWIKANIHYVRFSCGDGPAFGDKPLAATIMEMKSITELRKENLSASNGSPCRNWEIQVADPRSFQRTTIGVLCIDEQNHLPLEMREMDGKVAFQFSRWNMPVTIELPAATTGGEP